MACLIILRTGHCSASINLNGIDSEEKKNQHVCVEKEMKQSHPFYSDVKYFQDKERSLSKK